MEKSFEIRFPLESDYENLKALWKTSFDDSKESLDYFFQNTASPERVLAAFKEGKPVSALYMLESEIIKDNKAYSAYYIYAVCTHPDYRGKGLMKSLFDELFKVAKGRGIDYLFLVPEEEYLFKIYEKLGFKTGFSYSQKNLLKRDINNIKKLKTQNLTYKKYREIIESNLSSVPVAVLQESTFNSFFNSVSGEVRTVSVEDEGYALYEETEKELTIFELFGNEKSLLNAVFQNTEKEEIMYRHISNENPIPYGMYYKLTDSPEIQNGFFGIPYGN